VRNNPDMIEPLSEESVDADARMRAAERAQVILDAIGDAVVSTDVAGNITYLNPMAERMTGWSGSEASGRPLQEVVRIIDAHTREPVRDPMAMAMRQDDAVGLGEDCLLVRRDGQESSIEDTAAPIHDSRGQVIGAVIVFHDVGAARAMSVRMSHLAQHDVLTGLPNRLLLNDRLARAIASARRRAGALAVVFVDIDCFKRINDSMGHATGDQVLQSVAHRMMASVRDSDTVSRHGGDEFVVLLSEVACGADAAFSTERILAAIAAPHRVGGLGLHVTASVGIAVYPDDGTDAETLLRKADLAMLRDRVHRRAWRPFAIAEATASHVVSNSARVKSAPDGSQFPEPPPASV
jgi:diguanylate cyclase (GGDEF)-like protein/PAS domain S-box-containing protein